MHLKIIVLLMISSFRPLPSADAKPGPTMDKHVVVNVVGDEVQGNNLIELNEGSNGHVQNMEIEIIQNISKILGNNVISVIGSNIESDTAFQMTSTTSEGESNSTTKTDTYGTTQVIAETTAVTTTKRPATTQVIVETTAVTTTKRPTTTLVIAETTAVTTTKLPTTTLVMAETTEVTTTKLPELIEVSFKTIQGGRARASSIWSSNWSADRGFAQPGVSWHGANGHKPPISIWYEFPSALRVAKFSFQARTDAPFANQGPGSGPSRYEFWGSNGSDCSSTSGRVRLVNDDSGTSFTYPQNIPKVEYVENPNNYRCYGFTVKATPGNGNVGMSNIRFWKN